MIVNAGLREHLLTRRSVGIAFLKDPGPDSEQLREMLTMATRVPDHGKLAPWRLILLRGDKRAEAGNRLADLQKSRRPELDETSLDFERRQFLPAPLTVGILSTAKPHVKIPEFEQLLSASNVAFNLVHAAYAFGFAAQWVTRWYAYDKEASHILGAKDGERFVGFVHIGTPTTTMDDRPRPALEDVVSDWSPEAASS